MPQTIYRIVSSIPPADADYLTYAQMGRAVDLRSELHVRMAQGYSCFTSIAKARARAKGLPWRGEAFIATYVIEDHEDYRLEQTGERASHYTVWCDATVLKRSYRTAVPVRESGDGL